MNRGVLIIVLISCLAFSSCTQKPVPPTPPTPVNLLTVTTQQVFYYDKYPATTQALSQVNIFPEVQGYITGIFFTEGAHVKKGQQLYEIDKRLFQANYDAAVANLKVTQSNLKQAQQDADRYTYLNSQNAVATQLYDHAIVALQSAKDQVSAAEQTVKTAKTNFDYSVISAPFDGTIGFSQVKLGNMVTVGQTMLNTISTDDPMAVDFLVNEKQLPFFQELEKSKQDSNDSLFTILLPNNSLYPYTGKISVIDRAVDPQTGAIRIRLEFPNPGGYFRVGMSCIVRVHNQEATPQLVIPSKAVVEQMGEYFVFVAKDTIITNPADTSHKKSADTTQVRPKPVALQRKVQLGQTIGSNVIVKKGINEGDKIVVDGVQLIHDGSQISLGKKPDNTKGDNTHGTNGSGQKADTSKAANKNGH